MHANYLEAKNILYYLPSVYVENLFNDIHLVNSIVSEQQGRTQCRIYTVYIQNIYDTYLE